MRNDKNWLSYQTWHELLDALCIQQGHLDNMALADTLCSVSGNTSQAAFDTAVKNLRNWRQGLHIPQRRNFLLLTQALDITDEHDLRRRWMELYAVARMAVADNETEETLDAAVSSDHGLPPSGRTWRSRRTLTLLAICISVLLITSMHMFWNMPNEQQFEGVQADYIRNVSARVGDAMIIHGARGNDCGPAPTWEAAKEHLPTLITGKLMDGGVGTRFSRQCGGRVPARAILFKAESRGTEQTTLFGDEVHIRVE